MTSIAPNDAFTIDLSPETSFIRVRLTGDANMAAVERVGAALALVHEQAVSKRCTEVVVDVRQLEFMNSACFKKFVTWIALVEAVEAEARYGIRFLSNPKMHWQRRSLHALHCFALELVSVDT
jgi:hypothetical protein